MTDTTTTIDSYLEAYGERDPERRSGLIEQAWTPDCALIDPPMTGEGHSGVADLAEVLQQQFPGHAFRRVSDVDAHHDYVRFAWELVDSDGGVALAGEDVGEIAEDGRLRRIVGFFDALPARENGHGGGDR